MRLLRGEFDGLLFDDADDITGADDGFSLGDRQIIDTDMTPFGAVATTDDAPRVASAVEDWR